MPTVPVLTFIQFGVTNPPVIDRTQPFSVDSASNKVKSTEQFYGAYGVHWQLNQTGSFIEDPGYPAGQTNYDGNEWYDPNAYSNGITHTFAANAFAVGTHNIGIRNIYVRPDLKDPIDAGYADYAVTFATPPAAPTFTSPAAGSTVGKTTSISYSVATSADHAQMRVLNGSVTEWDSGSYAITSTLTQTQTATFPTNTGSRDVQVRVQRAGVWSQWATRTFTVTWTPPPVPLVTSAAVGDVNGFGFNHAIRFFVQSPDAVNPQPIPNKRDFYVRVTGSGDPTGLIIYTDYPSNHGFTIRYVWHGPTAGVAYDVRVVDKAADGTFSSSTWVTVTGTVAIKGIVLHTPGLPATIGTNVYDATVINLRLNDDEVEETREVESALVPVAGREFPLAEYGAGGTRRYTVGVLSSKGIGGTTDLSRLMAMLDSRKPVCYRDRRGRVMWGMLSVGSIKDTFYGQVASLTVDQTYDLRPNDVVSTP